MINKIKKIFYNILYSIPFGMKGANDEMFSQKENKESDSVGIHEVVQKESLGEDLLKGKVTEQVEELRYRNYKVYNESNKYEYLGNGIAVKKEVDESNKRIDFFQENKLLCADVLTELKRVDKDYGNDSYTLSVIYNDIPRFKLEKYCKYFSLLEKDGKLQFNAYFSVYDDNFDKTTTMFNNELNSIIEGKKSEFDSLISIDFVTYRAINEDDLIKYSLKELTKFDINKNSSSYCIKYNVDYYERVNLTDKFYCKSMDDKYKTKERKELSLDLTNKERERFCSECGKKISTYDGDITEKTYGYPLCKDCVKKILDF